MSITSKQNQPENLTLLAAQRQIYSAAKCFQLVRLVGAVLVGAAAPPLVLVWSSLTTPMAFLGGIALAVDIFLKWLERGMLRRAAAIQEQFDISVFELPWNSIAVGRQVTPELVYGASRKFRGDRAALRDWYADVNEMPRPLDVLFCQRSNLVWDWRLRLSYAWFLGLVIAVLIAIGLVLGIIRHQTLAYYLLTVLLPSAAAIFEGADVVRGHTDLAQDKREMEQTVVERWDAALADLRAVSPAELRQIQDCIYSARSSTPLVPDQWYWLTRKKYEADMRATCDAWKAQIRSLHRQTP